MQPEQETICSFTVDNNLYEVFIIFDYIGVACWVDNVNVRCKS